MGGRGRLKLDLIKKMVGILDMGGEGFDKGLEVGVDVCQDMFGGGAIGRDDGMAGVTRFVYFRQVQGGDVGLRSKEISALDKPWEGLAVEMRWWRSWLYDWVGLDLRGW